MYLNEIVGESAICINYQLVVAERSRKVAASKILMAKKWEQTCHIQKIKERLEDVTRETNLISKDFITSWKI